MVRRASGATSTPRGRRGAPPRDQDAPAPSGEHHHSSAAGDDGAPPLAPDVLAFLEHLEKERQVSPNTIAAYRRDLVQLGAFLADSYGGESWSWQGVDRLAMRAFLGHLQRRGLGKRSSARALSATRTFFRYLHREEIVDANPARAVGTPKLDKYLPSYLDRGQVFGVCGVG